MKSIIASLTLLLSVNTFAAPTNYELAQALVTITNANYEGDGYLQFLVCASQGKFYGDVEEDYLNSRTVSEYMVLTKGGDFEKTFQVNYSVVTSHAFVLQSLTRLNSMDVDDFACPAGAYEVYSDMIN